MDGQLRMIHFRFRLVKSVYRLIIGAERLISAERGLQRIVVEVKSFVGQSDVKDLEQALGQYVLYRQILNEMGVEPAFIQPYLNQPLTAYSL